MASSEPEGSLAPLLEPRPLFIDAAPSSRQSSRSTPPSPLKLSRPFTQRSQSLSHTRPDLDDFAPSDEQTPLLSHVPSQTFDASAREWTQALKRRSAVLSDLLSARNHSGVVLPPGSADQEEDQEEFGGAEIDRRPSDLGGGSLRGWGSRRSGGRPKGYDGEFRQELEGEGGNGVRSWYASYAAIDWIHDGVKEDVRKRKLRRRKRDEGIRGWLVNFWDGSQGWLLVTIVGFVTAWVAFFIIRSEMLLFDLKDGYCSTNPHLAKRFCCAIVEDIVARPLATSNGVLGIGLMSGWLAPQARGAAGKTAEVCESWRTWGQVWSNSQAGGAGGAGDNWPVDYVAFIALALLFSTTASALTIYLTSSTSVYSSKDDSPSVPYPGFSPDFPPPPPTPTTQKPSSASQYGSTDLFDETHILVEKPKPRRVMYFAAGSGIPEIKTILSGFVIRGYLGSWTLVTKSVGLALSVASGLSLGKEGPFVHIASCVGNISSRFFPKYDRNEAKRREIISAACAAGVAVSFGAPVGGTLFSLEEVSYFFPPKVMWRAFWCAMVAAVTLKMLDPFGSGKIVLFQVSYDRDWHSFELVGFLLLGAFGGVYGALFCKANIWWTRNVRNATFLKTHPILEVAIVTLVTVAISFGNPFTKMGGSELIFELFSECHQEDSFDGLCVSTPSLVLPLVLSLGFALVLKALLTAVTFGIKLPAGIFIPTLAVGACAGRIAGLFVEVVHSKYPLLPIFEVCRAMAEDGPLPFGQACVLPGVWAMVGAAATLAGVTRTTVSLAVIMFELTGTLNYTVPVMLTVLVAKSVGDAIEPRSIYDLVIELSDLPYLDIKAEYIHESTPGDIVDEDAPTINLDDDNTFDSLRSKLSHLYADGRGVGFPIVGRDEGELRMFGYIAAKELETGLSTASLSPSGTPCTFKTSASIRHGTPSIPFSVSLPGSRTMTPSGCDLSYLVDQAPVSVSLRSPMVLLHEMFTKLGVRYLVVVDERGVYRGVIEKNRYLKYLQYVERIAHEPKRPVATSPAARV